MSTLSPKIGDSAPDFEALTDATGTISVMAPSQWRERDLGPVTGGGLVRSRIRVAPSLEAYVDLRGPKKLGRRARERERLTRQKGATQSSNPISSCRPEQACAVPARPQTSVPEQRCDRSCLREALSTGWSRLFAAFQACVSGPAGGIVGACRCFDMDGDGDVDLADFIQFQICFTGPGGSVIAGCECADFDDDGDVVACSEPMERWSGYPDVLDTFWAVTARVSAVAALDRNQPSTTSQSPFNAPVKKTLVGLHGIANTIEAVA